MTADIRDSTFHAYEHGPPPGEWAYILDDFGVDYRQGIIWPFAKANEDEHIRNLVHGMKRQNIDYQHAEGAGGHAVRLAPDVEYGAWGGQYVLVFPSHEDPSLAQADLRLWDRPQGLGGYTVPASIDLDLVAGTATVADIDRLPEHTRPEAEMKAARLIAFFQGAMSQRDAGVPAPATAHAKWTAEQARHSD